MIERTKHNQLITEIYSNPFYLLVKLTQITNAYISSRTFKFKFQQKCLIAVAAKHIFVTVKYLSLNYSALMQIKIGVDICAHQYAFYMSFDYVHKN